MFLLLASKSPFRISNMKSDLGTVALVAGGIVGLIALWNLLQPTSVTVSQTVDGQPVAGAGVDPFDSSAYTVENLANLGGLL
jgi:hypothetical protein